MGPNRLGLAFSMIRGAVGITQRDMAKRLGISAVHLCYVERGRKSPSLVLIAEMNRQFFDPYVTAWLMFGSLDRMPKAMRPHVRRMQAEWQAAFDEKRKAWRGRACE